MFGVFAGPIGIFRRVLASVKRVCLLGCVFNPLIGLLILSGLYEQNAFKVSKNVNTYSLSENSFSNLIWRPTDRLTDRPTD